LGVLLLLLVVVYVSLLLLNLGGSRGGETGRE
jgi:hypothetical protein